MGCYCRHVGHTWIFSTYYSKEATNMGSAIQQRHNDMPHNGTQVVVRLVSYVDQIRRSRISGSAWFDCLNLALFHKRLCFPFKQMKAKHGRSGRVTIT